MATIIAEFLNQSLGLKVQKFYVLPTDCIRVFFIHLKKKQRIFPSTVSTYLFLQPRRNVFTAQYELGL
jgi:hypothetical protein